MNIEYTTHVTYGILSRYIQTTVPIGQIRLDTPIRSRSDAASRNDRLRHTGRIQRCTLLYIDVMGMSKSEKLQSQLASMTSYVVEQIY